MYSKMVGREEGVEGGNTVSDYLSSGSCRQDFQRDVPR